MKKYEKLQQDLVKFMDKEETELKRKLDDPKQALEFHRDDGTSSRGVLNSLDAGISHAAFSVLGSLHARIESQDLPEFLLWLQDMLTEVNKEIP